MSQSLVKNNIHLIFSTKGRTDTIRLEDIDPLKAYMMGILSNLGCFLIEMGGTRNHVHILFTLNKNETISNIVQKLKSNSSKWLKEKSGDYKYFAWQLGYGAFSVSESKVDVVRKYINNQLEHHKKVSFEDEFREFLKAYSVQWDERYVWD